MRYTARCSRSHKENLSMPQLVEQPLISVVIPSYNVEHYVRECLDSLAEQGVENIQVICVNDGSTDGTLTVLQEYAAKDARIEILDGPNGGYGKAMNRGLAVAKGKYFAILEPDDYLPEQAYAKLLKIAQENNLDFVKGCTQSFFEGQDGKRVIVPQHSYLVKNTVLCPRKTPPAFIDISVDSWNGIYNLDFLRRHHIEYHESPGASYQDTGFFMQTFSFAERAMFVDVPSYMYRTDNAASSTSARSSKPYALSGEYAYIRRKLEAVPEIWNEVKPLYLARRVGGHRWIYYSLKESMRLEYLREVRKEFIELEGFDRFLLPRIDKYHLEKILVSPEHFLTCEAVQDEVRSAKRVLTLLSQASSIRRKYYFYKLLSVLTFGKSRKRNQSRAKRYREVCREIRLATRVLQ